MDLGNLMPILFAILLACLAVAVALNFAVAALAARRAAPGRFLRNANGGAGVGSVVAMCTWFALSVYARDWLWDARLWVGATAGWVTAYGMARMSASRARPTEPKAAPDRSGPRRLNFTFGQPGSCLAGLITGKKM